MDLARTIINDVETNYYYHEFAVIRESERERLKPFLYCPTCKAKATFRRASVSGAQAHFSLRSGEVHEEGCYEVKYDNDTHKSQVQREDALLKQEVEKVKNDNNIIEIVTSGEALFEGYSEAESVEPKTTSHKPRAKTSASTTHVIESTNTRASEKDLVKLLKYCMRTTKLLAESNIVLKFRGRNYKANNSIFNFFNIQQISNSRRPYFFWGSVKFVKDLTYINVGQGPNVSVIIDDSIRDRLWEMMRVNKHWQLVGCNIICFGWAKKKNSLTYISIKNIDDIAFLGVKPNNNYRMPSMPELSSEPIQSHGPGSKSRPEPEPNSEPIASESSEDDVFFGKFDGDSHFPITQPPEKFSNDGWLDGEVDTSPYENPLQEVSSDPPPLKDNLWQKIRRFFG